MPPTISAAGDAPAAKQAQLLRLFPTPEKLSAKVALESAEAPMKRLAIVGAVLFLAGPAQAFWGKDKREEAEAACKSWASKAGTFISKSGPFELNPDGPGVVRRSKQFSARQNIRFCRNNARKQLTEGAEFRSSFINDSCQMGLKFDPYTYISPGQGKEKVMETFWRANCGGKGNPSTVLKTWSW